MRSMKPEDIPTDFGVLPGTFVKPEGKDMPPLFKDPQDRLRMEWTWLKSWFGSVIALVHILFVML
jgi:mitochondrial protein MBA1